MSIERWQDLVLSLMALIWAVILALPDDVLGRVRAYSAINKFAPDIVWSVLLAACAFAILFTRDHIGLRAQAHVILGILWSVIVTLILLNGTAVTSILIAAPFAALALLHFFEYLRLSALARV